MKKLSLKNILEISRPRFWLYLAGPFLIGYATGVQSISEFSELQFFLYLLYFLFPTNLFLYGINDLADEDTDKYNSKKSEYEHQLKASQKKSLTIIVSGCALLSLILAISASSLTLSLLLLTLLFLSYAYSYLPFRWKARPFIDSTSNVLYIIPGIFAYYLSSGNFPPVVLIISGWAWSAAMHLFSAVPDISADKKANLLTTAVFLGKNTSLYLCSLLWFIAWVSVMMFTQSLWLVPLIVYPVIPLLAVYKNLPISKVYRFFPAFNGVVGFALFWYSIIYRFF